MSGRFRVGLAGLALLALGPVSAPGDSSRPQPTPVVRGRAAESAQCQAEPPGFHDARAKLRFSAVDRGTGQARRGTVFEYGKIRDLLIEVRWDELRHSARQRVELYAPNGDLFQMFPATLEASPDPILLRVPAGGGSWIMSGGLSGTWCAKVFLDDDEEPVAAESFELRRP